MRKWWGMRGEGVTCSGNMPLYSAKYNVGF